MLTKLYSPFVYKTHYYVGGIKNPRHHIWLVTGFIWNFNVTAMLNAYDYAFYVCTFEPTLKVWIQYAVMLHTRASFYWFKLVKLI